MKGYAFYYGYFILSSEINDLYITTCCLQTQLPLQPNFLCTSVSHKDIYHNPYKCYVPFTCVLFCLPLLDCKYFEVRNSFIFLSPVPTTKQTTQKVPIKCLLNA